MFYWDQNIKWIGQLDLELKAVVCAGHVELGFLNELVVVKEVDVMLCESQKSQEGTIKNHM